MKKREDIKILSEKLGFDVNPHMITESLYLKFKFGIELDPELNYSDEDDPLLDFRDPERFWNEKFPEEMKELFNKEITSEKVIYCFDDVSSKGDFEVLSKISPELYLRLVQDVNDELIKDKELVRWYLFNGLDLINGGYITPEHLNHFMEEWDYGFVVIGDKLIMYKDQFKNDLESCLEEQDFEILPEEICLALLEEDPENIIKGLGVPYEIYHGDTNDFVIIEKDKYIFGNWYTE